MTPRTLFLIELIDKLGVPLMTVAQGKDADTDSAETLAGLLSSSVKLGLSMTDKMGLHEEDGDVDSVRVALTASASRLIADSYAKTGNIPIDAEHERISKAIDALISFAENFTASKDHTQRLKSFGSDKPLFDAAQSQIFYFSAMQPVLAAVAAFPFGQSETRLIQDIAEKLQTRAKAMREALSGSGADDGEDRFTELMILHALARVYADAHERKTVELEKAGNEAATSANIEDVWSAFDTQLAMLETLLNVALPGDPPQTESNAPQAVAPAPVQAPETAAPPQAPAPQPEAAVPPPPPAAPANPGNPMGFFTKKDEPQAADTPPPEATAAAPEQTPAATAPPPPPPTAPEKPAGESGNPMSFFKPGAQEEGE